MKGWSSASVAVLCLALLVGGALGAGITTMLTPRAAPKNTTPYQAVLLSNGSAYFGKLEGLGTSFPILREVYYVQSTQDPETKKVSNILVKRGKEWHAPDHMVLNSSMIVLVEPVSPDSRVAKLIKEAQK
ncbi:MAG: hypothetical protein ABSG26_07200 [Bryobacteraceae bacterium]